MYSNIIKSDLIQTPISIQPLPASFTQGATAAAGPFAAPQAVPADSTASLAGQGAAGPRATGEHAFVVDSEDGGRGSPLARALEEAGRVLSEARRQAETIAAEAYREGFEQGERAGMELGRQKVEPVVQRLDSLVMELVKVRETMIREVEGGLIAVALAVATRILHKEVSLHPDVVVSVAREALKRTISGGKIALRVNPLDVEFLQQSGSLLPEFASHSDSLTIQSDYGVLRGGVIVETESGQIDATLDTQLAILWNALNPQESGNRSQETEVRGQELRDE